MFNSAQRQRQEAQLDPKPPAEKDQHGEKRRARQKIAIFVVLLILFSGALALARLLVPYGTEVPLSSWTPPLADMLGMWSVGLAGLLALLITDRSVLSIGFGLPPVWFMLLGCAVPLAYCVAIYLPIWSLVPSTFAGKAALSAGVVSCLVHLPRSLFAAAGEELGWRGTLVPSLARVSPPILVAFAPGALWAVWHYPDILFFGYNVGTPSLFELTCFSIGLVGTGAFLSWIRLASRSVWPCIIFHGVHNSLMWGLFERATSRGTAVYFTNEFGLGFALVGVAIGYTSIRYCRCHLQSDNDDRSAARVTNRGHWELNR